MPHTPHLRTRLAVSALVLAATTAATAVTATPAHAGGGETGGTDRYGDHNRRSHPHPYHLVITVTDSGDDDGTYELYCDPVSDRAYGQHPEPEEGCEVIEETDDPFAPVTQDSMCTYMYGGPATADVSGTWAGEPVEARFTRVNGCEIARWDSLVPALPRIGGDEA